MANLFLYQRKKKKAIKMLAQEDNSLIFNLVKLPITEFFHVEKVCSPISFSLQNWAPFMPVLKSNSWLAKLL